MGRPYFVHISALGAKADHRSNFFATKGKAETLIRQSGRAHAIVRPSIVLTPGTPMLQNLAMLIRGCGRVTGCIPLPNGGQTKIQPILPSDLAQVIRQIAWQKPRSLTVDAVGPRPWTLAEIAEKVARAHGQNMEIQSVSIHLLKPFAMMMEQIAPHLFSREHLVLLGEDNCASVEGVIDLLDRVPGDITSTLLNPLCYRREDVSNTPAVNTARIIKRQT